MTTAHSKVPSKKRHFIKGVHVHLVPRLEITADFEPHGEKLRQHSTFDIFLEKNEFITDGHDELAVVLFVHRMGAPADKVYSRGQIKAVKLAGTDAEGHQLVEDLEFAADPQHKGKRRFAIRSSTGKPLLYISARAGAAMKLEVEAEVAQPHQGPAAAPKQPLPLNADFLLQPAYIYLNLWVVPGQPRGTSTAGVASFIVRAKGQLQDLPLEDNDLELKAAATGSTLTDTTFDAGEMVAAWIGPTTPSLTATPLNGLVRSYGEAPIKLPPWLSAWRMQYDGLNWANIMGLDLAVFCRFAKGDEAVAFHINVRQNILEMVNDIDAHASQLELTNPEYQSYTALGTLDLALARRECRGWIYDLREIVRKAVYDARGLPHPPDLEKYVCGELSHRLRYFVIGRRHGTTDPQTALHMNGIEACQYIWPPWHDWFGFHLSGAKPSHDPIFLDPWWRQEWTLEEMLTNHGFKKQAALLLAVPTLIAAETIVIGFAICKSISLAIRAAGFGAPLPTLAEVMVIIGKEMPGRITAVATLAATLTVGFANWCIETPTNGDVACFDDDFNYAKYDELSLFENYCGQLRHSPAQPLVVQPWPS